MNIFNNYVDYRIKDISEIPTDDVEKLMDYMYSYDDFKKDFESLKYYIKNAVNTDKEQIIEVELKNSLLHGCIDHIIKIKNEFGIPNDFVNKNIEYIKEGVLYCIKKEQFDNLNKIESIFGKDLILDILKSDEVQDIIIEKMKYNLENNNIDNAIYLKDMLNNTDIIIQLDDIKKIALNSIIKCIQYNINNDLPNCVYDVISIKNEFKLSNKYIEEEGIHLFIQEKLLEYINNNIDFEIINVCDIINLVKAFDINNNEINNFIKKYYNSKTY